MAGRTDTTDFATFVANAVGKEAMILFHIVCTEFKKQVCLQVNLLVSLEAESI